MSESEWSKWIEWKGGECPLANGVEHRVKFRDGEVSGIRDKADSLFWRHYSTGIGTGGGDIIAYRVKRTQAQAASANATQVGGTHYKDMPIQPWEVMEAVLTPAEFRGYLKGCILKYSMRAGKKEGTDDAGKARHYRQKLREVEGGNV